MEFSLLDPLRSLVETGGPVVGLLLAVSVVALTLIVVKIAHFWRAGVGRHRRARNALAIWESGDKSAALAHAHEGVAPVSRLLAHGMRGLRQPGGDMTLIREDVERVAIEILASLRSGLRALDAIAQVAPLLGLFGTVLGMIEAFRALQAGGSNVDPAALAGGIWVALLTTAVGLGIAMPASLAVSWFEARIDSERVTMETLLTALFTRRPTEHAANVRVLPVATGEAGGPRNAN